MSKVKKYILQMIYGYKGDKSTLEKFQNIVFQDCVTRDEGAEHHVCVSVLPYNSKTSEVLVLYDKDNDSWRAPGGHVGKNETPHETAIRHCKEKLGKQAKKDMIEGPFYLSISNSRADCGSHYNMWFYIETDSDGLKKTLKKAPESRWVSEKDAGKNKEDSHLKKAISQLNTLLHG